MTPDFESAVMRKVAWRLIPFLSIGYMINALDRFNVSMAALTMNKELGLSASAYGFGAGAFFWSYILFQFPANLMLAQIGARIWISMIMVTWGICSAGTALITGETSFVLVRFLLGIAEAGFFPGVAYFMTCWFPALYRGRMMGIFYACGAFAGVLGGPLGANLLKLDGTFGLAGWQWIFVVEGLPAVALAVYGFATLCNRPVEARWLTAEQRTWLQTSLDTEAAAKSGHGKSVLQSIANPQVITLTLAYVFMAYGVYALAFFLPLIVKSLGLSNTAIGYVLVLPNLCGTIGMILFSRSSDRTGERIWHVVLPLAWPAWARRWPDCHWATFTWLWRRSVSPPSASRPACPCSGTCQPPIWGPARRRAGSPSLTRSATSRATRRRRSRDGCMTRPGATWCRCWQPAPSWRPARH